MRGWMAILLVASAMASEPKPFTPEVKVTVLGTTPAAAYHWVPLGAQIFLDGRKVSIAPAEVTITAGLPHALMVKRMGSSLASRVSALILTRYASVLCWQQIDSRQLTRAANLLQTAFDPDVTPGWPLFIRRASPFC